MATTDDDARERWTVLKLYASAKGVPYAVLLGIVGRTLGKFQSAEKLTQAQADWCKARVDEVAEKTNE